MQTKQSKLISIAVLAVTLFSAQLFGMDIKQVVFTGPYDERFSGNPTLDFEVLHEKVTGLKGRNLDLEGARSIAEILEGKFLLDVSALKTIDLEFAGQGYANKDMDTVPRKSVLNIANALKKNTTVESVDLSLNRLTVEEVKAIAEALKVNNTLKDLNLKNNNIGAEGAQAIAEALKENTTLEDLNLGRNNIDLKGVQAIAEALKENAALRKLNLKDNPLWRFGCVQALAEALRVNNTLRKLNLREDNIGVKSMKLIVEALKVNFTLISIKLRSKDSSGANEIDPEDVQAIVEVLIRNSTKLVAVRGELRGSRLSDKVRDAIKEACWKLV